MPLFCGFSKNCWHFPGWQPPPGFQRMLHRTPPQRLHIWSQVAQIWGWGECVCVGGKSYVLNQICTQTEQRHRRLCFGSACLQECICVGFCLRKLPASLHTIPPPKSAFQHPLMPGEGALLSCHHGGQRSAAGGIS